MVRGRPILIVVVPCILLLLLFGLLTRSRLSWPPASAQWPGAGLLAGTSVTSQASHHKVEIQEKEVGRWGERHLGSLPSCRGVGGPHNLAQTLRWHILRSVVRALNAASVPYFLTDGSLLFLVRECGTGETDIDVAVEATWWKEGGNPGRVTAAMESAGLHSTTIFGQVDKFGYEERWVTQGLQVDVFAADTVVEGERRESLWTGDNVYPCILKVESFAWYTWWGEQVRLPHPLEPALVSMYGPEWTQKSKWHYFLYFGQCENSGLGWNNTQDKPGGC